MNLWFRRTPRSLFALLTFRNEMRFLPDYFENVRPIVDGVVALDDGSTDGSGEFVRAQPEVVSLLRNPPRADEEWDDVLNHRRLVDEARRLNASWVVGLDADERLEHQFRERAERVIARGRWRGIRAYHVIFRELWDDPRTYRADGVWGRKVQARLFEVRRDHRFHDQRLHGHWAPLNSMRWGDFVRADLILYHLRMLDAADRELRRQRYEMLDPERKYQAIGYSYLTDTAGLRLERIQLGREYRPLPSRGSGTAGA